MADGMDRMASGEASVVDGAGKVVRGRRRMVDDIKARVR